MKGYSINKYSHNRTRPNNKKSKKYSDERERRCRRGGRGHVWYINTCNTKIEAIPLGGWAVGKARVQRRYAGTEHSKLESAIAINIQKV